MGLLGWRFVTCSKDAELGCLGGTGCCRDVESFDSSILRQFLVCGAMLHNAPNRLFGGCSSDFPFEEVQEGVWCWQGR